MNLVDPADLALAVRLVDQIGDEVERDEAAYRQAFADGYHAGHQAGRQIGYGYAAHEMAEAWHVVAGRVRPHGRGSIIGQLPPPSFEERNRPGGQAYNARLARHGGQEYRGGPVSWEGHVDRQEGAA